MPLHLPETCRHNRLGHQWSTVQDITCITPQSNMVQPYLQQSLEFIRCHKLWLPFQGWIQWAVKSAAGRDRMVVTREALISLWTVRTECLISAHMSLSTE